MRNIVAVLATFLLSAALGIAQERGAIKITNEPTVESVTNNSATVAWATSTGGSNVIKYGTDPNRLDRTAQSEYSRGAGPKRVRITGLQPNTTYYFQVVSGQAQGSGTEAKSDVLQLRTLDSSGTLVPIYRLVNQSGVGIHHLFTTAYEEARPSKNQDWKREGVAGYISKEQRSGTAPLFRLVGTNNNHFYTTNESERDSAAKQGFKVEGVVGYVATAQVPGTVPLHRLYNATQAVHHYTTDEAELATLKGDKSWNYEGITGYVWEQGEEANQR